MQIDDRMVDIMVSKREPARLLLLDSATWLDQAARDRVVVCGSHAGRYSAVLAARAGIRAIVLNDAGIGLRRAGVAGLGLLDESVVPAVAVDHRSARIGDAADMLLRGVLSEVNETAGALGCVHGQAVHAAAALLAEARPTAPVAVAFDGEARHAILTESPAIWALDSASLVRDADAGAVLMLGSHGGLIGTDPGNALRVDALAAVFNDAGGGADDAGIARLAALDRRAIPAATVSAASAAIGDGRSTYHDGMLSAVNGTAQALGARPGITARRFADLVRRKGERGDKR